MNYNQQQGSFGNQPQQNYNGMIPQQQQIYGGNIPQQQYQSQNDVQSQLQQLQLQLQSQQKEIDDLKKMVYDLQKHNKSQDVFNSNVPQYQNQTTQVFSGQIQQPQQSYSGQIQQGYSNPIGKNYPVYRYVSSVPHYKYYISTSLDDAPKGFQRDKKFHNFNCPDPSLPNVIPIYRIKCLTYPSQGYLYRKEKMETKDWSVDGICCYLFKYPGDMLIPIYLQPCQNPHREIINPKSNTSGSWKDSEILGYAYEEK
eukprot:gene3368-5915_t